ncbi:hypothetical protein BDZ90DRAFT_92599 [Jaminaea rosea]|uniref:Uncharacterized protein n=1 Tax=Jaminaea rosea TaxID=1569628 RepID=A0A316UJY5_9BASI|nr:hypothetical protein BDZ90DRAFT_92599 [Jaminaea rosea]PWN24671.1 hypothetical protein BDZ90DRAFT_92599 [Jaminaea rosea]
MNFMIWRIHCADDGTRYYLRLPLGETRARSDGDNYVAMLAVIKPGRPSDLVQEELIVFDLLKSLWKVDIYSIPYYKLDANANDLLLRREDICYAVAKPTLDPAAEEQYFAVEVCESRVDPSTAFSTASTSLCDQLQHLELDSSTAALREED